ncbi:SSL2 DNA or RNA helicases of superfamily II [uncultured Caudovirales phage]|uniref:SSL2 DNA or RNA helicases of superfamily II n=1 Tax=uncultured Caudovirales phage TaxID=2100421 RepID=A0A6J5LGK8_9CAUD|nr:SSL2 DNA or RNA helicases of superfamily II [uncultured Caudovirales phage]
MQAKLIIRDEINVKIEGLELRERKDLVNKYKFEIPGARYQPSVRLGRWDGKVSFFQLGGSTYINLLPEIIPFLDDRGYDVEVIDLREYKTTFEFNQITEDTFSHIVWPKGHPKADEPIKIRDYQIEIVNNFLQNPQSVQEVATGAGKTIMTAALSYSVQKYGRTIVIVPNKSLVTQTEDDYKNLGLDVGVYFGDRKEFGHTHTICTWQSLNNLAKASNDDVTFVDFLEDVVCVIVDEVHMAKADVLKSMLSQYMGHIPIRWGLTGTIPKEQYAYVSIYCMLGNVIGRLSASELQEQGVLAQCHVNVVQLVDHAEYTNYQSELKFLLENEGRLDYIGKLISTIADSGNTLILVDRIAAGKALVERIPGSVFISSNTKVTERKEHYDEVAEAENKTIIATYGVAAVGINIPRIFNLVLIEPGKSFVRVIQSIGRGIRKAEDKDFVQIWDITSTCKFAKRHLTKRKQFYNEANYPHTVQKAEWK